MLNSRGNITSKGKSFLIVGMYRTHKRRTYPQCLGYQVKESLRGYGKVVLQ